MIFILFLWTHFLWLPHFLISFLVFFPLDYKFPLHIGEIRLLSVMYVTSIFFKIVIHLSTLLMWFAVRFLKLNWILFYFIYILNHSEKVLEHYQFIKGFPQSFTLSLHSFIIFALKSLIQLECILICAVR